MIGNPKIVTCTRLSVARCEKSCDQKPRTESIFPKSQEKAGKESITTDKSTEKPAELRSMGPPLYAVSFLSKPKF